MSPPQKLTFTPKPESANEHPSTFVVLVDEDAFTKYVSGDKSMALATIVDSFDIFKFDNPGKEGTLAKPSKAELLNAFGTNDENEIMEFMLEHGTLHGNKSPAKKAKDQVSPMENLLNAERRAY